MPYARKDKIQWLPGHYYHIFNRGARRLTIFREQSNYNFVLGKMKKYRMQFNLSIIAYCLLPNHYHFLVRQNGPTYAGYLPQRIFNSYSKAFNRHYGHSGTLFESRYKAIPVTNDDHLLHLCRYIHANPVIHGIAPSVEEWPYSNYLEWVGLRGGSIIDRDFVNEHFDNARSYGEFVQEYLVHRQLPGGLAYLDDLDN